MELKKEKEISRIFKFEYSYLRSSHLCRVGKNQLPNAQILTITIEKNNKDGRIFFSFNENALIEEMLIKYGFHCGEEKVNQFPVIKSGTYTFLSPYKDDKLMQFFYIISQFEPIKFEEIACIFNTEFAIPAWCLRDLFDTLFNLDDILENVLNSKILPEELINVLKTTENLKMNSKQFNIKFYNQY